MLPPEIKDKVGKEFYDKIPDNKSQRGDYLLLYGMPLEITPDYKVIHEVKVDGYTIGKVFKRD